MTKYLMNIHTGSVDTAENWKDDGYVEGETDGLVEVEKDENGDWVEVE